MLDQYLKEQYQLQQTQLQYTQEDLDCLGEFISALGIPLPENRTFYQTRDRGALILWSELGVTIRTTHNTNYPKRPHSHVLQPLLERQSDRLHIGLFPGLKHHEGNFSEKERSELLRYFRKNGVAVRDFNSKNIGYLPNEGEPIPIIIDPDCGTHHYGYPKMIELNYTASVQREIFAPLRETFEKAWPLGQQVDHAKMQTAFITCLLAKKTGMLHSDWKQNPYYGNYTGVGTTEAAREFGKTVQLDF